MRDLSKPDIAIETSGINKSYGREAALRDVTLQIPWGEVLVVLGPNGSGKSTLIKVLAGLTQPDGGTANIAGFDTGKFANVTRRLLGVVTHDSLLYEGLTGYENLRFAAHLFGLPEIDRHISAAADTMGLTGKLHNRISTLSHGIRRRFAIARALLHNPPVLLMDEPESGLDQEALEMLDDVIRRHSDQNGTALITTHNTKNTAELANRVAILVAGKISYEREILKSSESDILRETYAKYTGGQV